MINKTIFFLSFSSSGKTPEDLMDKLFRVLKARPTMYPYIILCILFTSIFLEEKQLQRNLTWLKVWYWSPQVGSCLSINRKDQKFDHIPGPNLTNWGLNFFVVLLYQEWAHDCFDGEEVLGKKVGSWERVTGNLLYFPEHFCSYFNAHNKKVLCCNIVCSDFTINCQKRTLEQ